MLRALGVREVGIARRGGCRAYPVGNTVRRQRVAIPRDRCPIAVTADEFAALGPPDPTISNFALAYLAGVCTVRAANFMKFYKTGIQP